MDTPGACCPPCWQVDPLRAGIQKCYSGTRQYTHGPTVEYVAGCDGHLLP